MTNNQKAELIVNYFNEILPSASCELDYITDYGLLISVVLSAQTTDKSVNKVTPILFSKYPTLEDLSKADIKDIESCIKQIGLYHAKAKNIKLIANDLVNKFNGKVPNNKQDLMSLPGVGNKTANVVLCELFHAYGFPVDTHLHRLDKSLKLAKAEDNVEITEKKLRKFFNGYDYILLHHQFIHFGRYTCLARSPHCENCKLSLICREFNKNKK